MRIRRMKKEDLEEVGPMYAEFYTYHRRLMGSDQTYSPEWGVEEVSKAEGIILVAEDDELLGFARVKEDERTYFLKEIYVKPEHRGKGVGKALLEACEREANGNLYLSVIPANLKALDFFLRQGYTFLNTLELTKYKGKAKVVTLGRVFEAITEAGFNLRGVNFEVVEGEYCLAICDEVPPNYLAVIKDESITVITKGRPSCETKDVHCGYRVIKFSNLPLEMVGLMALISNALASEGISLLALSSYRSDFVIVKEEYLDRAISSIEKVLKALNS